MVDLVFSAPKGRDLASGGKNHISPRTIPPGRELRGRQKAPGQSFFKKVLETAARELKLKDKIEISVNLIGEAKIKKLNKKYRHKNKPTDVLSFPLRLAPLAQDKLRGVKEKGPELVEGRLSYDLGDIFICLSIAKKEAKRENISIEKKLAQLTVHGFLHLAGYDHENSVSKAKKIEKLEADILSKLSL